MTHKINEKFKQLLPPLSAEEYNQLEESILAEGVRESVKLWQNFVVDGHNRVEICEKHDLDFPVKDMFFDSEDDALEWIYINQLGRRNLLPNQKTLFIGELYELRKKKHGGQEGNSNATKNESATMSDSFSGKENPEVEDFSDVTIETFESEKELVVELDETFEKKPPKRTAQDIAKQFGVSPRTVERAGKVAEAVKDKPELKQGFLAGKVTQKEILTPKPPAPEPTQTKSNQDAFTQVAAKHGRTIHTLLTDLQTAIVRANNEFAANGQDFDDFAKRLRQADLSLFILDARLLKTLSKCAKCKGEKCEKCKQTGYQNKSNYSTTKSALSV